MEPELKVSSSPLDRIPVETVIKIVQLSLLQVDSHPLVIMRRVEELRLVNTYWAKCIDQCPTFWTHITSRARPARHTRWLEKSQNAPLHVDSREDDEFMELLLPHTDIWQSLTFFSSSPNALSHLTRPAPQLQELDLYGLPTRNYPAKLFQGVIPRLNTIRLYGTLAPWHIFRGLRELVLDGFLPDHRRLRIDPDGFLQALESSPSLEVLSVKGVVEHENSTLSHLDPVTLPSLRSFVFDSPSYFLLGLIRIPNCTSTFIKCGSPVRPIPVYPSDVWLAVVEILRLTVVIDIRLYPTKLSITTQPKISPHLKAEFAYNSLAQTMLIDLLREAELSQPLPAVVNLHIESTDAVPPILDFLAKSTESGTKRLPKLQELYLKLHKVPVETVAGLILGHEKLSVLWSRPRTIGKGWSRPEDITDREAERAYPDQFDTDEEDWDAAYGEMTRPTFSMPGSPGLRNGAAAPGDMGMLTEEMQGLSTSDHKGGQTWHGLREDDQLSFVRSCAGSVRSGASTPGNGGRILSERDLRRADEALEKVNGVY